MTSGSDSLYKLLPKIKRARDYHLYDFGGRRYLDLWADGGRALMGHRKGRSVLDMKSCLEKGLGGSYPSVYPRRLLKQLGRLYPSVEAVSVVFAGGGAGGYPVYRPFSAAAPPEGVFELLVPMPGSSALRVLCAGSADSLPASDPVPAFLLAGLCRAAADLASFDAAEAEKNWASFDCGLWRREGPWLYSNIGGAEYDQLFKRLKNRGIVISPYADSPSCAPSLFTAGEIKPIRELADGGPDDGS